MDRVVLAFFSAAIGVVLAVPRTDDVAPPVWRCRTSACGRFRCKSFHGSVQTVVVLPPDSKWTPVHLVPFAVNHRAVVTALAADPVVRKFSRIPDPPPTDLAAQWLERYADGRRRGTREAFAILAGGAIAGMAVAPRIDQEARTAELGYMILRKARGHGIATSALRLLSDWAFGECGLLRLELLINVQNEPSKRVASKCGYRMEGVLRSIHQKQDIRIDCEIWSRLVTDPAPRDECTGRQSE